MKPFSFLSVSSFWRRIGQESECADTFADQLVSVTKGKLCGIHYGGVVGIGAAVRGGEPYLLGRRDESTDH